MSGIQDLSAAEVAAQYSAGALSPVEVVQACLARIAACETKLNAMYRVDREGSLAAARASESRWRAKQPLSPLDGVPVTIKENLYTRGDPAPIGTRANDDARPQTADAPPPARLREAGCVILGKTTMPDFGMLSSGLSSIHGVTRNPWRLDRNTSGSSAGAGAAAAAGYAPLHLGTDIGGSLRLPAGWCGIFSLKPSLGRIPIDPPYTGRAAGPMTRSVADAALMMQVLSLPDPRDSMSLPYQALAWDQFDLGVDVLRGRRFGLLLDAGCGLPVEPEVKAAIERAAHIFERAGAIIEPMAPFMTPALLDGMDHAWRMRSYLDLSALPPEKQALVLPYIQQWADSAAGMSGPQVFAAVSHHSRLERLVVMPEERQLLRSASFTPPAWPACGPARPLIL